MSFLDLASFIGCIGLIASAMVGAHRIGTWIHDGVMLERRRVKLGRDCMEVAGEVLEEDRKLVRLK